MIATHRENVRVAGNQAALLQQHSHHTPHRDDTTTPTAAAEDMQSVANGEHRTGRHTDRQADRQTDRQTDGQTDRQTDRQMTDQTSNGFVCVLFSAGQEREGEGGHATMQEGTDHPMPPFEGGGDGSPLSGRGGVGDDLMAGN